MTTTHRLPVLCIVTANCVAKILSYLSCRLQWSQLGALKYMYHKAPLWNDEQAIPGDPGHLTLLV